MVRGMGSQTLELNINRSTIELSTAFPGPLVLPNDHLAIDPRDPPQSFRSWLLESHRNEPTKKRKTLYVAAVPEITAQMRQMREWLKPKVDSTQKGQKSKTVAGRIQPLRADDYIEYLTAFYHGMTVKPYPEQLKFVPWPRKADGDEKFVGLATDHNCTRVRARPSPDGLFSGQLNLEDILDAAIEMLPGDAYAIVLLLDHDLYEDDDDDFCCGRAYGGSRVCVVSAARYHPVLDEYEDIDQAHMWPASHCQAFVDHMCRREGVEGTSEVSQSPSRPQPHLRRAIDAAKALKTEVTPEAQRGLLFSRLVRTVAHELGHCFGMGHCNYYACSMQGTAGMAEDVRQPPYLCPVCLSKVTHAMSWELHGGGEEQKEVYVKERYEALVKVCDKWNHVGLFAGYAAWLRARLESLQAT